MTEPCRRPRATDFLALTLAGALACSPTAPAAPELTSTAPSAAHPATDGAGTLRFAVGSMLSAVATFEAYDALFADMSQALGRPYRFLQRRSYQELNDLIVLGEVDLAIICSGPWVSLPRDAPVELGVVPVVDGQTTFQALVVVRADSPARSFADLDGRRFAFTDPLSLTGYAYPVTRTLELGSDPKKFFSATLFSGAHDRSLMAVDQNLADAASVSSLGFYVAVVPGSPYWGRLRVLEKSPPWAVPPVVLSTRLSEELRARMRDYLIGLASSATGKAHLARLGIDRFVLPPAGLDYEPVRRTMEAAARAQR